MATKAMRLDKTYYYLRSTASFKSEDGTMARPSLNAFNRILKSEDGTMYCRL